MKFDSRNDNERGNALTTSITVICVVLAALAMLAPATMNRFVAHPIPAVIPMPVGLAFVAAGVLAIAYTARQLVKYALLACGVVFMIVALATIGLP